MSVTEFEACGGDSGFLNFNTSLLYRHNRAEAKLTVCENLTCSTWSDVSLQYMPARLYSISVVLRAVRMQTVSKQRRQHIKYVILSAELPGNSNLIHAQS